MVDIRLYVGVFASVLAFRDTEMAFAVLVILSYGAHLVGNPVLK